MNKELLPFESESLSRKELNALIAVTEENGNIRKKHRPVLPVAAAVAATVAVSSVGVYAAVTKGVIHKESVNNYYDSKVVNDVINFDISELIEEQVSENEHFRITIESVLTDDMTVNLVATLEALDERGADYLKNGGAHLKVFLPCAYAYDTNGEFIEYLDTGYLFGGNTVETETTKSFTIESDRARLNGTEEIIIKLYETFYSKDADISEDIFTGIEFKVKTKPTLKTYTFAADNGYEVRMSQYKFYRMDVPYSTPNGLPSKESEILILHYKGGDTEECYAAQFGYNKFDIERIESLEFEGFVFYPKK